MAVAAATVLQTAHHYYEISLEVDGWVQVDVVHDEDQDDVPVGSDGLALGRPVVDVHLPEPADAAPADPLDGAATVPVTDVWSWTGESDSTCPPEPADAKHVANEDGAMFEKNPDGRWMDTEFPDETFTWVELLGAHGPLRRADR